MDAKAEKRQNGLGYGQKILMQVTVISNKKYNEIFIVPKQLRGCILLQI